MECGKPCWVWPQGLDVALIASFERSEVQVSSGFACGLGCDRLQKRVFEGNRVGVCEEVEASSQQEDSEDIRT